MPEIAIIGSGAAGALAAWRLRQRLDDAVSIVVFEKEPEVGGRAKHIQFAGERVELGGTLIHTDNRRLVELAQTVGVPLAKRELGPPVGDGALMLWDGQKALLRAGMDGIGLPLALIKRYGPFNLLKLRKLAKQAKAAWNSIYALQDAGQVFETPADVLEQTGLAPYVGLSLAELAHQRGIGGRLVDEFVTGVLRDMYNQTADIVALAGLVGLAGAGLAGGSLVAAVNGNSTLFAEALRSSGAKVQLDAAVTQLGLTERGVSLTVNSAAGGEQTFGFDAVIIAAPMELAGIDIQLSDVTAAGVPAIGRSFQAVYATVVAGQLDPGFFGVDRAPGDVLTIDTPAAQFKAFGQVGSSRSLGVPLWKFFSAEPVAEALLEQMFGQVKAIHQHLWQAYPVLHPAPQFRPFRLAQGLYQINDFESAVSTLETEGTIGWSVADLVVRDLAAAETSA
jgi:phytoene dehydrogenase-like protein